MREKILSVSYRLWLVGKIRLRPPQSVAEVWGSLADDDVSDDKIVQRAREKKSSFVFSSCTEIATNPPRTTSRCSPPDSSSNLQLFRVFLVPGRFNEMRNEALRSL